MPRRQILTAAERISLLAFPESDDKLIQHYSFSESDLALIRQRRGEHNRFGFAVQLCYLRYPSIALPTNAEPPDALLTLISEQLAIEPSVWSQYAQRPETRREHFAELQLRLNLTPLSAADYRRFIHAIVDLAKQTDRGFVLAEALIKLLRQQRIILPSMDVIERMCSEALTRGTRQVYEALTTSLSEYQHQAFEQLIAVPKNTSTSTLIWLRQSPGPPRPKHILVHLQRLQTVQALDLPDGLEHSIHQNRLLKLAREGGQMTAQHLGDLEPTRRFATLVAIILETRATLIDEVIDLHDRFMGSLFSNAKRRHAEQFQRSGKDINHKVHLYSRVGRALLDAKEAGADPYAAIEAIMPWEVFSASISEAEKLAQSENFDYLALIASSFNSLRRYTPTFLNALNMKAAPAARELLAAIELLKSMNQEQSRKVPDGAPTGFVRNRWKNLVHTPEGIDRRFYEMCVLSELKNALRSGDIWVKNSRQFKDFKDYLLPPAEFEVKSVSGKLGLSVEASFDHYMASRLGTLKQELATVERLALADELPDAAISSSGRLKITPLDNTVPNEAAALIQQVYSRLPHLKITDLLLEVDNWTGFTQHFTHLKSGAIAEDRQRLLTTILADAINLGLSKMAESCPGTTYAKLTWLQAWHIRDETYSAGLACLVNAQLRQPFAALWGQGTMSSSDGQNSKAGGSGRFAGQVNLKYGQEPGVQFYTHISDQYIPFHTKVINATVRDATHVLDGLLYHESDLRIEEHYTDTAGFTDHVFALMQLLRYRFAPRIRDLADRRLYTHTQAGAKQYPTLESLIGGTININTLERHSSFSGFY